MTLKSKVDILFLVVIIIFAGLFYVSFQSSGIVRESSKFVTQTHEILYNLEKVESSVTGIEAAHRGFVISGKEDFLGAVEYQKQELEQGLEQLNKLLKGNQEQQKRLEVLSAMITRKLEVSEHGAGLRRKVNTETALGFISTGRGKLLMDSIRMTSKALEKEEINSLNDRTNQNEIFVLAQNRNYFLFSAFTLLILFALYLRIRQNTIQLLAYQKKQDELIKELNYQNRQLDDFAHLTSHNIRSPAVNIYTLISLLNENSSLDDYKMIFGKLTKVSQNLNETLNELIDVLQIKNNRTIERGILSFEDVLNKVKESMQGDIMVSKAGISGNFEEVKTLNYPKSYLESIFHNLLSNAIKYRSNKRVPEIRLSTRIENEKVVLEVADNGLGIDMERFGSQVFGLRKIFHSKNNAKGVGLFMTKTQIETLGGSISVTSEVDKGSVFKVIFDEGSIVKNPENISSRRYQQLGKDLYVAS